MTPEEGLVGGRCIIAWSAFEGKKPNAERAHPITVLQSQAEEAQIKFEANLPKARSGF